MNIEQAKSIPLSDILSKLGHEPVKNKKQEAWYLSPFRAEKTPSFKLHLAKNIWFDFGEGQGGDVIAFACQYLKSKNEGHTVHDALRWLRNMSGLLPKIKSIPDEAPAPSAPVLCLKDSGELKHIALIKYLEKRGIPLSVAKPYLKEVRVYNRDTKKQFFALGLKNEEGDWELRNPFFKGCAGTKSISFIRGTKPKAGAIHLFEGLMDYLTVIVRQEGKRFAEDAIILNSLSCLDKATPYIQGYGYKEAFTWMDNDMPGRKATQLLDDFFKTEENLIHKPMNSLYAPYKDVNAWHMHTLGLSL